MKQFCMLVLLLSIISVGAGAQQKFKFRSQNYTGLLEGENGSAFQFQTINGVQRGRWFMGIGAGLDWYLYRSVPLFLSVNHDWKLSNRTFYFSLDAGTNYSWEKGQQPTWNNITGSDFFPGFYGAFGIGYKAGLKNGKDAILINLGYNFKRLKEEVTSTGFCNNPPCADFVEYYDYKMQRASLRLGWQF